MAYEAKTTKTKASVTDFIAQIPREETRRDSTALVKMMKRITGEPAAMWGPNIIGFGTYSYVYASGHTGDWPLVGFSPRKPELVMYILREFAGAPALMKKLGRYRVGKVCLYVTSLADVDQAVLEELITGSVAEVRRLDPAIAAKAPAKKKVVKKTATKKTAKAAVRKAAKPAGSRRPQR